MRASPLMAAGVALAGLALAVPASAADGPAAPTGAAGRVDTVRSCAVPTQADRMACGALKVVGGSALGNAAPGKPAATPTGYGPADLQSAYGLPSATAGAGRTVAVVAAYDDPKAESDLAAYRAHYNLPACTTAGGCFRKTGQSGTSALPRADAGWAEEISLDLDMVSASCPLCHILLVEADSASMADLGTAVNTAVALGARYVSNSYGGAETSADTRYDTRYFQHPGVAITVSSGDNGYGVSYPASSRYVTAVGGTSLTRTAAAKQPRARDWSETVWSGTGSGCSAYDAKPAWQQDTTCARRTVTDVSAVADPATGVSVYDTYGGDTGWEVFGGTSASAPLIAGVYALAGTPSDGSYPASFPYAHTADLNDVVSGSNGSCGGSYLCTAAAGYDGPSGVGTPSGVAAFAG